MLHAYNKRCPKTNLVQCLSYSHSLPPHVLTIYYYTGKSSPLHPTDGSIGHHRRIHIICYISISVCLCVLCVNVCVRSLIGDTHIYILYTYIYMYKWRTCCTQHSGKRGDRVSADGGRGVGGRSAKVPASNRIWKTFPRANWISIVEPRNKEGKITGRFLYIMNAPRPPLLLHAHTATLWPHPSADDPPSSPPIQIICVQISSLRLCMCVNYDVSDASLLIYIRMYKARGEFWLI